MTIWEKIFKKIRKHDPDIEVRNLLERFQLESLRKSLLLEISERYPDAHLHNMDGVKRLLENKNIATFDLLLLKMLIEGL